MNGVAIVSILEFQTFLKKSLLIVENLKRTDNSLFNFQAVGRAVGYMFNQLRLAGFDPKRFHCMGHSLGGHICAYAGKWTQE